MRRRSSQERNMRRRSSRERNSVGATDATTVDAASVCVDDSERLRSGRRRSWHRRSDSERLRSGRRRSYHRCSKRRCSEQGESMQRLERWHSVS